MHGERLGLGYWVVGAVVVAGAVGYWHTKYPFNQPTYVSAPSEVAPIEAVDAFKAAPPIIREVKPVVPVQEASAVVPSSTPPPEQVTPAASANPEVYDVPVVISYPELMENMKLCPRKIRLKEDTNFPAMLDGKQIGTVLAPAGSEVDFIKIAGEKSLVVGFGPAQLTVSADLTNFEDLYVANVKASRKK